MKNLLKIVTSFLALTLLCGIVFSNQVSAKSIYFAGKYKGKSGKLELQEYSSWEDSAYGKNVGYCKFYGFKNKKKNTTEELYKKKKNHYESRNGFITIIVKKKYVSVKGWVQDFNTGKEYSISGKYKLTKRFPMP